MSAAAKNLAHKTLEARIQLLTRTISALDDKISTLNLDIGEMEEQRAEHQLEARQIAEILKGGAL